MIITSEDPWKIEFKIPKSSSNQNLDSTHFKGYKILYRIYPIKEGLTARSSDETLINTINNSAQTTIAVRMLDKAGLAFEPLCIGDINSGDYIGLMDIENIDYISALSDDIKVTIDFNGLVSPNNNGFATLSILNGNDEKRYRILRAYSNYTDLAPVDISTTDGDFDWDNTIGEYNGMEMLIYVVSYGINLNDGASTIYSTAQKVGLLNLQL